MFDQIFGNYLVASGYLTEEQFKEALQAEAEVRVKLGLIAVTEKMMTKEQADEVNHLQAIKDKRFGDIAVEKGYLTEDQVGRLLKKQGNIYMVFVQALIDKGFMTLDEIDGMLQRYQGMEKLSSGEMDDLVSGDVDRVIGLFLPNNDEISKKLCGIAVRTILRLIDSGAYVSKAYLVDEIRADNFAMQVLEGDRRIYAGFAGLENGLLSIAEPFGQEEFGQVDMDALDAVGEFINCINGLFASEQSTLGLDVDMLPPQYFDQPVSISGNRFVVFPLHIGEQAINYVIATDTQLKVESI